MSGHWQLEVLRGLGLQPSHRLLELAAGSFCAGVRLVPYLQSGHYYGLDLNVRALQCLSHTQSHTRTRTAVPFHSRV